MTLEVKQEKVIAAYNAGDDESKKLLETLFGKDKVCPKITERVKTFWDALGMVKVSENIGILLGYNGIDKEMLAAQAFAKLSIIHQALNEGWEPDYSNKNEPKYYPWFKWTAASGFSFFDCDYDDADSIVGARLSFKSSELAKYAAEQFADLYRDFLTL